MPSQSEIVIQNQQKRLRLPDSLLKSAVNEVFKVQSPRLAFHIGIRLVDDRQMRLLNCFYSGKDNPTDVLSFEINHDKQSITADIVISTDTAVANSRIYHTSYRQEVILYLIHGLLHLFGYDDHNPVARKRMEDRQELLLKKVLIKIKPG